VYLSNNFSITPVAKYTTGKNIKVNKKKETIYKQKKRYTNKVNNKKISTRPIKNSIGRMGLATMILDWDNTLFPTGVLNIIQEKLHLRDSLDVLGTIQELMMTTDEKKAATLNEEYKLYAAYWRVFDKMMTVFLLSAIKTCKKIVIVTAATKKWIDVCMATVPESHHVIKQHKIEIRASKDTIATEDQASFYKLLEFIDFTPDPNDEKKCTPPLIVLGDSHAEHMAAHLLQNANVYHFWFHYQSCLCGHIRQLQSCQDILHSEFDIFTKHTPEHKKQAIHLVSTFITCEETTKPFVSFARYDANVSHLLFGQNMVQTEFCKHCQMSLVVRK
jgi:hypothetical protein